MKKGNQLARIEQYIGQLQAPESKDAVILLDSELDNIGSSDISPKSNEDCTNAVAKGCASNGKCTNIGSACDQSVNVQCFNDKAPVVSVGCGSTNS